MKNRKPSKVLREIENIAIKYGWPIIGPKKGEVLTSTIRKYKPKKVLEIGVLVGYSSILMSQDLPKKSKITGIDISPEIVYVAKLNFKEAGVDELIDVKVGDALNIIPKLKEKYDMVFLDAQKDEYIKYLNLVENKLSPNAVIVADNVKIAKDDMKDYLNYVRNSKKFNSKTYDFGYDAVEVSVKV